MKTQKRNKKCYDTGFNDQKKQFTFDDMMKISNDSMKANKKLLDKLAEDD